MRETDGTLAKTPRIKVVPANMKLVDATRVELEQLEGRHHDTTMRLMRDLCHFHGKQRSTLVNRGTGTEVSIQVTTGKATTNLR